MPNPPPTSRMCALLHGGRQCREPGQYPRMRGKGVGKITIYVCGRHLAQLQAQDAKEAAESAGGAA